MSIILAGNVTVEGVAYEATVRLYLRSDGSLVDETTSDVSGNYSFVGGSLDTGEFYYVIALYEDDTYNALIWDWLQPEDVIVGTPHRYWRIDDFALSSGSILEITALYVFQNGVDVTSLVTYGEPSGLQRPLDNGTFAAWADGNLSAGGFWNGTVATMKLYIDTGSGTEKVIDGVKFAPDSVSTRAPIQVGLSYSDDGITYTPVGNASIAEGDYTLPAQHVLTTLITQFD